MTHQPRRPGAAPRRSVNSEEALPDDVLDQVLGGAVSNIMKTKHDTVKNSISNIH